MIAKLLHLRDKSAAAERAAALPKPDSAAALSAERRAAWHRQLSGLVGSERLEEVLLRPVVDTLRRAAE